MGKRTIGVGLYVPTVTPYYLGAEACGGCHSGEHSEWEGTAHAHAWETLQNSGHPAPFCNPCHSVGYEPGPNTGNSGYDEVQIANGYAHFGPHANPQADMMIGKSASHGVSPGFEWASPSHILVQNSCKTCHLNMIEFPGPAGSAVTGHTFLPMVEACANCHGQIASFEDIPASGDFDGDGVTEGLQLEVDGLIHLLEDALLASGLDTTGVGFEGALGDTSLSTVEQRTAGYNLVYVEDDKSRGIHNPDYAVQLLQQSILYIGGTLPNNARIIKDKKEAVAHW